MANAAKDGERLAVLRKLDCALGVVQHRFLACVKRGGSGIFALKLESSERQSFTSFANQKGRSFLNWFSVKLSCYAFPMAWGATVCVKNTAEFTHTCIEQIALYSGSYTAESVARTWQLPEAATFVSLRSAMSFQ